MTTHTPGPVKVVPWPPDRWQLQEATAGGAVALFFHERPARLAALCWNSHEELVAALGAAATALAHILLLSGIRTESYRIAHDAYDCIATALAAAKGE